MPALAACDGSFGGDTGAATASGTAATPDSAASRVGMIPMASAINRATSAVGRPRNDPSTRTYVAGLSTRSCTVQSSTKHAMLSLRRTYSNDAQSRG